MADKSSTPATTANEAVDIRTPKNAASSKARVTVALSAGTPYARHYNLHLDGKLAAGIAQDSILVKMAHPRHDEIVQTLLNEGGHVTGNPTEGTRIKGVNLSTVTRVYSPEGVATLPGFAPRRGRVAVAVAAPSEPAAKSDEKPKAEVAKPAPKPPVKKKFTIGK